MSARWPGVDVVDEPDGDNGWGPADDEEADRAADEYERQITDHWS